MKVNELTIGQKYIWKRNSSVSNEVTYLECDDSGKYPMYEFEYLKEYEKMQTLLSVDHVDSDIKLLKSNEMKKIEVRKYKSWKQKGGIILYEDFNNGLWYLNNNIWSKENPLFGNVNFIENIKFVIIDYPPSKFGILNCDGCEL